MTFGDITFKDALASVVPPIVAVELAEGYRGYQHLNTYVVIPVNAKHPHIQIVMYMKDSPCHPQDMMLAQEEVNTFEVATHISNAIRKMEASIDLAFTDPNKVRRLFADLGA